MTDTSKIPARRPTQTGSTGGGAKKARSAPAAPAVAKQTKAAHLRAMLAEPEGASLARIMAETGWQAHSVRAALSGLRKAGTTLAREKVDEVTVYRIVAGEAAARTARPRATHTPGSSA